MMGVAEFIDIVRRWLSVFPNTDMGGTFLESPLRRAPLSLPVIGSKVGAQMDDLIIKSWSNSGGT